MVAPASRMAPEVAESAGIGQIAVPGPDARRSFSIRSSSSHGHFAGDDETRAQAFLDIANDESYDAVWFARRLWLPRGGSGHVQVDGAVQTKSLYRLQ